MKHNFVIFNTTKSKKKYENVNLFLLFWELQMIQKTDTSFLFLSGMFLEKSIENGSSHICSSAPADCLKTWYHSSSLFSNCSAKWHKIGWFDIDHMIASSILNSSALWSQRLRLLRPFAIGKWHKVSEFPKIKHKLNQLWFHYIEFILVCDCAVMNGGG